MRDGHDWRPDVGGAGGGGDGGGVVLLHVDFGGHGTRALVVRMYSPYPERVFMSRASSIGTPDTFSNNTAISTGGTSVNQPHGMASDSAV